MSKAQEADIKFNPIWCNKYETKGIKHFKKSSKIYSDYTQFLPKITEQKSSSSSFKTQEVYFYLLNNQNKLMAYVQANLSNKLSRKFLG